MRVSGPGSSGSFGNRGCPRPSTLAEHQQRFTALVAEYHTERSHEALDRRPPAECYVPSPRVFPAKLPAFEYAATARVRQVRQNGEIKWPGHLIDRS